jgi:hypothetical protein
MKSFFGLRGYREYGVSGIILVVLCILFDYSGVSNADLVKQNKDTGMSAPGFVCKMTGVAAPGDEIAAIAEGDSFLCRITRKRGIGKAEITRTQTSWPEEMQLEFAGFSNLESLVVYDGGLCLSTSLKSAPAVRIGRGGQNGDCRAEENIQSRYQMQMTRTPDGITVVLPRNLLSMNRRSFQISWIDEYR